MKNKTAANNVIVKSIKKYFMIFLLPTLLAFIIGFIIPFFYGIYLSFFKFRVINNLTFNGLNNYLVAFKDETFIDSFSFTFAFAMVSLLVINIIAFLLAYALTSGIKGSTIFRTIFFMPNLVGGIVLGYIFKYLLNEVIYLLFDSQLLLEAKYGFWGLIILVCWQQIGYMMIIYIAGLQNVSNDYLEAAKIDGASNMQILAKIIIPSIMPSITICTFLTLTNSFKLFDQNLALTAGQPFKSTEMMALNIYNSFYQSTTNMGIGQAKAVIFFVIVTTISLLQLYLTKKGDYQQ